MYLYGHDWPLDDPIAIELECIRQCVTYNKPGHLFQHIKSFQSLCWPWKVWDRWSELLLHEFIYHPLVGVHGAKDSSKTHNAAAFVLTMYCALPDKTAVLVSSTDSRSLELRIWGEIKMLFAQAKEASDAIPGHAIGSRQLIATDAKDAFGRDFRKGIIGIPCRVGGEFVGMASYVGIKQDYIYHVADEMQFMEPGFYDSIANLSKKRYKCIALGNPKDRSDCFGKLTEPLHGWESLDDTPKTRTWPTKWPNGVCVELFGPDSPNCTRPPNTPKIHDKLIDKEDIEQLERFYGKDSYQVQMFGYGRMPKSVQDRRVITRAICERNHALEPVTWDGITPPLKLFALDAAYGATGGDRCIGIELHYGRCVDGKHRLSFHGEPLVIPVSDSAGLPPENQIALWVKDYCERPDRQIAPENMALDTTGRGTLVSALARLWSPSIVAVEFGGVASERPVNEKIKTPCRDYYYNMMSELWYSMRYLIEADMLRNLPIAVMEEACQRQWWMVAGCKTQVEPKTNRNKHNRDRGLSYKERLGRSPDISDAFVTGIELARRRGMTIGGLLAPKASLDSWLDELRAKQASLRKAHSLVYAS